MERKGLEMTSINRRLSRRDFLRLTGLTGLSLAATRCGAVGPQAPGKSSVIAAITVEPNTLDPFIVALDVASSQVMGNVYEALLDQDFASRSTVPMLAESWEQRSPTVWAFKLREGVQFHKDFGELTAEDVVYNVELTIDEEKPRSGAWQPAVGARAVSKYEVEIELAEPDMPWLLAATTPSFGFIASKRAIEEMGFESFQRDPVGTGPFEFESWTSGSEIVLKRFEDYRQEGLPRLEGLSFRFVEDALVKRAQLENGELDFVDQVEYKDVPDLRENENVKLVSSTGWNWDYLTFGLQNPDAPWSQKAVRQAIAYAINRQAILEAANTYAGEAIPTDDPLPPGFLGSKEGPWVYPESSDLDRARSLMDQAGYGSGFGATCITSAKPNLRREMELVGDQLSEIGIELELQGLDTATYNEQIRSHEFDLALEDITVTSPDTHRALYAFHHPTGSLNHGYDNPRVTELLDEARFEQDNEERARIYAEATQLIVDDAPYVFTVHVNLVRGMNPGLTGFPGSPQEGKLFFREVAWEA